MQVENGKILDAKERIYRQFFSDYEQNMNQRAKGYLDKILTEEIKKDLQMRMWESNGSDPTLKGMNEHRVK